MTFLFSCLPSDVKFDAVSGDYYPIVYFNDYWNLQKDYYPINDTLTTLPLRLSYCPISLWRWQLYAAQNARSPWNFLPEDTYEQSDEDQDSVKVSKRTSFDRWNSVDLENLHCDLKCFCRWPFWKPTPTCWVSQLSSPSCTASSSFLPSRTVRTEHQIKFNV